MKDYYCAIDIGSSLCHVIIGRFISQDSIEIVGTGSSSSLGIKTGSIVNIESAVQALSEAIHEAELVSGIGVSSAMCNITGKHIRSDNSRGVVAVTNKDRIVSQSDILRVIEGAQNIRIQNDQEIIHVLSREFSLDNQNALRDPVGMTGIRLEAEVHIVTAGITALNNLNRTFQLSGIHLDGVVLNSLASSEALLQVEEKDLGVALIDIGGGTSDLIIYNEGGLCSSSVIPFGGIHITQDLSIGLKIPIESAEFIKKNYGVASPRLVDPTEKVELPHIHGRMPRTALRQQIAEITEARLREILEMIERQLIKSDQKVSLTGGVILTGGCTMIEGIEELSEEVLGLSVSTRAPHNMEGFVDRVDTPEFSTGIGILQYKNRMSKLNGKEHHNSYPMRSNSVLKKFKNWLVENI